RRRGRWRRSGRAAGTPARRSSAVCHSRIRTQTPVGRRAPPPAPAVSAGATGAPRRHGSSGALLQQPLNGIARPRDEVIPLLHRLAGRLGFPTTAGGKALAARQTL